MEIKIQIKIGKKSVLNTFNVRSVVYKRSTTKACLPFLQVGHEILHGNHIEQYKILHADLLTVLMQCHRCCCCCSFCYYYYYYYCFSGITRLRLFRNTSFFVFTDGRSYGDQHRTAIAQIAVLCCFIFRLGLVYIYTAVYSGMNHPLFHRWVEFPALFDSPIVSHYSTLTHSIFCT